MKTNTLLLAGMRRHAHFYLSILLLLLTTNNAWAIPPAITTQPVSQASCAGSNANFSMAASNANSYQWQVNQGSGFVNITNGGVYAYATTPFLSITGVTTTMNGYLYRCIATGPDAPAATTNAATLTVNDFINITSQPPSSRTVCSGTNTTLSVAGTGTISSYQWYGYNGSSFVAITNNAFYSGATTGSLTITPDASVHKVYYCVLMGPCNQKTSNYTYLTVNGLPTITTQPTDFSVCQGFTTGFSVAATGTALTYQWQVSYSNGSSWSSLGNNAVFSGVTTNQLTINNNTGLNNSLYRCIVSGACTPAATSNAARLTVFAPIAITVQPENKEVCQGLNTFFHSNASGTVSNYQWQELTGSGWTNMVNDAVYSGVNSNILSLTATPLSYNGKTYRCVATDGSCNGVFKTTNAAYLTVIPTTTITSQPATLAPICSGQNASYSVSAEGNNLTYQWYVHDGSQFVALSNNAVYSDVTSSTLNITGITAASNTTTYIYRCTVTGECGSIVSESKYLTVNALPTVTVQPVDVTICEGSVAGFTITATGSDITYQWQVSYNNGSTWTSLSNNATFSSVNTRQLFINANNSINNSTYRCVVNGICAPSATSTAARLTVSQKVAVSVQPVNTEVCEGLSTFFFANGSGNVSGYQWQRLTQSGWSNLTNDAVYSGVNSKILRLTATPISYNNNAYRCVINDNVCTGFFKITNEVILSVKASTAITAQPAAVAPICSGGNASFSVTAKGDNLTYQWYAFNGSQYAPIGDTGAYTGTTTSELQITGITTSANSTTFSYRCNVTGSCNLTVSTPAYLTVNGLPAITSNPSSTSICEGNDVYLYTTATGANLTYQWEKKGLTDTVWTNVMADSTYQTPTTNTLIVHTGSGYTHTMFRCKVNSACSTVYSSAATVTMNAKPSITLHPVKTSVCSGGNTSFSITATGTAITYQWYVNKGAGWILLSNDATYSNVTTNTLGITNASATLNNYLYSCNVSGTCTPPALSNAGKLTVDPAISITSQPSSVAITAGNSTSFSVTASGGTLTYQWQENSGSGWTNVTNGGIYSGATSSMLNLTSVPQTHNSRQYRCMVANTCSVMDSSTAVTLTVNSGSSSAALVIENDPSNLHQDISPSVNANVNSSENVTTGIEHTGIIISELKLYPNPNNGRFTVTGNYADVSADAKISVINTLGQVVYNADANIKSGVLYHEININNQAAAGIYILRIDVNNKQEIARFNITR